jgi:pectin methylesterase-like acyl-CoA thioesterase
MSLFPKTRVVVLAVFALALGIFVAGCQTGQSSTRKSDANAFEQPKGENPSCPFG